ncbi:GNAT family N-acetyltransferase [Sphingomonas profundi]|uniref:GNAT family N-acetyltransferase n=1 Tax=Alterirhizorhabdus profundi TaxID=2681549 RepID=UPI003BB20A07
MIVPLGQADPAAVETLLDEAFGADRHRRTAYRLRQGVAWLPALSFAAIEDGGLVGTIQCWPIALSPAAGPPRPINLVGPVAVQPGRQRDGLGRRLMQAMLDAAGDRADLVLIGDPEYYGRFFGFTADATGGWSVPGPVERHRLLARLRPGASDWPVVAALGPPLPPALAAAG